MTDNFMLASLLNTAVFPFLACMVTFSLLRLLRQEFSWLMAVVLFGGCVTGFGLHVGSSTFPPAKVVAWFPYFGLWVLFIFSFFKLKNMFLQVLFFLVALAPVLWVHFKPLVASSSLQTVLVPVLVFGFGWCAWWCGTRFAMKAESLETFLIPVLTAGGVSAVVAMDGSTLISMLAGVLSSSCAALFFLKLFFRDLRLGLLGEALFGVLLGALVINAYIYAEVSPIALLFAVLPSLSMGCINFSIFQRYNLAKRCLLSFFFGITPLLLAAFYLWRFVPKDPYGY